MPLYMDFHKFPNITLEEAKKAHMADEEIQQKYGVKYLQFWVNEGAGTIFCLVEGPDMHTCQSVHQMAHGHIACAMVEVDPSYYSLIMGKNIRIDQGLVHDANGAVDLGYRSILAVDIHSKPSPTAKENEYLNTLTAAHQIINQEVSRLNGRPLKITGEDCLVSVFNFASWAVECSAEIQSKLIALNKTVGPLSFSIGLSAGQPVTENNEFIEETIRLARRLCLVAGEDRILCSSLVAELCEDDTTNPTDAAVKSLNAGEDEFVSKLFDVIDTHLADEGFNVDSLVRTIGISRPQLYRKIQALTGKAPNDLIGEVRLNKAWSLLKRKSGNISEVAYEVGFSNPSYFARCFKEKFGCLPSQLNR